MSKSYSIGHGTLYSSETPVLSLKRIKLTKAAGTSVALSSIERSFWLKTGKFIPQHLERYQLAMEFKCKAKALILIILMNFLTQNVNAKSQLIRLDKHPQNASEAESLIRKKLIELEHHQSMNKVYSELAKDAKNTALLTRVVAPSGIALIAWPLATIAAAYGVGGITAAAYGFGTLVGTASTFISIEILTFASSSEISISERDLIRIRASANNHSVITFNQLQNDLDKSRENIMERYFDGSLKNQIMDSVRLGGVSKEGTYLLWLIQSAKVQAYQEELAILQSIHNSFIE